MSKRKVEKKNRRKTLKNIGGMNLFGKKKRLPTLLSSSEARAILQPISILVSEGYIETPTPYIVSPQESSPLSGVSRYLPALPADVLSSGYEMNKLAVLLSMLAYAKTGATTTVPVVCGEPIFDEFNDNFLNMELVYFDGLTEMSFQIGQVPFEITMVKTNDYDDDDKKISVFDVLNALYHAYKKNNDNPGEEITSSIDRNSDSSLKNDPELNEELKKLLGEEKGKNRSATAPVSYTELNTVSPSYLSEPVSTVITSPVAPPRPPPPTTAKAQPLSPISTTAETPPRDTSPVSEKTVYTAPTPRDTSPVSDAVNSSNIITPIDRPKLPFLKEINKTETQGIEGIKSTENTLPENKKNDLLNQLQKVKLKSINGKKTTDNPESEQKFNSEMVDKVKEDFLRKELNNKIQNVKKPDDDSDDESDDDSDDDPDKWQGGAQSVGSYDVFVSHPIKDWMTAVCLFLSQADSQLRLIVSPFISPDIQMKRKTDFEKKTNRFLFFLNFLFELHQAIIIDPTTDPFFIDSSIQKSIAETLAKLKTCKIILEQETESYNFEFNNGTFTKIKNKPVLNYFANLVRQDIVLNNFELVQGPVEYNYIEKYYYDSCDVETETAFVDMKIMKECNDKINRGRLSSYADPYFDGSRSNSTTSDQPSVSSSDVPERRTSIGSVEANKVFDENLEDAFQGNFSKEEKNDAAIKVLDEDLDQVNFRQKRR